jgi:regulator of protease activity HflC (stomatin/prohibitin superfamily)
MGDFLAKVIDILEFLWPLDRVDQWEEAGYYRFGRFVKVRGPGVYFRFWWFERHITFSVVPTIVSTPRLDITLRDGTQLSLTASATCRVVDLAQALNTIDQFQETTQEAIAAVLADKIASVDASRLLPEGRGRLLSDLTKWVNEETIEFGVESKKVRFTTFVLKPRMWRMLNDMQGAVSW